MSSNVFSIIVKCWYDTQSGATHLQVVRTDTAEELHLSNSTFLLRTTEKSVGRCYIRHIASGREAYAQGGPNLYAFVKTCLLNSGLSEADESGVLGNNETIM